MEMNMEKQEIIDFEHIFQNHNTSKKPDNIKGYIFSISTYLFVMFILATFLFIFFRSIPSFLDTVTPEQEILNLLETHEGSFAVLKENTYIKDIFENETMSYQIFNVDGFDYIISLDNSILIQDELFDFDMIESYRNETDVIIITLNNERYPLLIYKDIDINVVNESYQVFTSFSMSLLNFVIYILLFIPIIWFLKNDLIYDWLIFKSFQSKILGFIISGYIYVFLGNIVATTLTQLISALVNIDVSTSVNQSVIVDMLFSDGFILTFLSAVILGPIVEELVFRKAFFGLIKNTKIALISSSLIFGLIHVTSESSLLMMFIQVIPYVTLGFVFGYMYIKHEKNIMVPIIVHMLSNFISIVLTLIVV